MSLFETSSLTATCVSTCGMLSNTSGEICLGLGQPDGSNNKEKVHFKTIYYFLNQQNLLFLVPISDGLQSPDANLHKSISVKA